MQTITLSTASSVADLTSTTAASKVALPPGTEGPSSSTSIPPQFLRVMPYMSVSAATATLGFYLRHANATTGYEKITRLDGCSVAQAATPLRTSDAGGASGGYLAQATFTKRIDDIIDLLGYSDPLSDNKVELYVACEAISSGTITLRLSYTRAV